MKNLLIISFAIVTILNGQIYASHNKIGDEEAKITSSKKNTSELEQYKQKIINLNKYLETLMNSSVSNMTDETLMDIDNKIKKISKEKRAALTQKVIQQMDRGDIDQILNSMNFEENQLEFLLNRQISFIKKEHNL